MKTMPLSTYLSNVSSLVYGCMGLGGGWNANAITAADVNQANMAIDSALENNINYFDHADIYTLGKAEQVFGHILRERKSIREQMYIQTKCGIRFEDELGPKRYDFSTQWMTHSVNKSLLQLNCDYLDVLVLHRPDPLMEAHEVADTFHALRDAGKVRFLGVSNMQQYQIAELQQVLDTPLVVNQVEMSLHKHDWLDETVYAGNTDGKDINFTPGLLQYCRQNQIQIQAWGSLCQGLYSGVDVSTKAPQVQQTQRLVAKLAGEYGVSAESIVLGWLMRHPAMIQPVIGTTNPLRIKACSQVSEVELSREHWYALYISAKGQELP
ncbi:aldo/keto reductase [Shewanella aestuarii]|uniref:Aldo/keto reductase n=1 Tax=Shewanella aestuarii TaxID=1028752 RepID=A0A6G9QP30_9GAMM|nr:aldo/keto reductase [Shewanella aestuarii]QIR15589.1 aldo/keto reductase [Shewanella aestuarii]